MAVDHINDAAGIDVEQASERVYGAACHLLSVG